MTRRLAAILALAGTAAVSGCAGSGDPHEGGFITGVTNLMSGGYQQRIDQRQAEVASLGAEQAQLQARADAIRQEQAQVDRELGAARTRMAQLNRRIAALRAKASAADAAKLDDAQRRLALARSKASEAANRDRATSDRAADVADLQQVLDSVGGLVDEIARTTPTS
ncbi:hypothetical protein KXR53_29510 [Inquilinus limosus]|uniref:hypothetical protein n=1 Tax=Inquilinus limosus TaxID=171674 RepID=UPI003F14ED55